MLRYVGAALLILGTVLGSHGAAQAHKPPPWHLVDVWWNTGRDRAFESYTKQDRRPRKIGPGLLMSMWGERSGGGRRNVTTVEYIMWLIRKMSR